MPVDLSDLYPGDAVNVFDTSNGKNLEAYLMRHEADGKLRVWIKRFDNPMLFSGDGTTPLGRFKLTPGRVKDSIS